jgi:hypothetical protein
MFTNLALISSFYLFHHVASSREKSDRLLEVKHHLKANGNRMEIAATHQARAALPEPSPKKE